MEHVGFFCYCDWLKALEPYGDAERGRIWTALLKYAATGDCGDLSGNERFVLPMMIATVERDLTKQKERAEKARANGKMGGRPKNQTVFEKTEQKLKNQTVFEKSYKQETRNKKQDISIPSGIELKPTHARFSAAEYIKTYTVDTELQELLLEWLEIRKKKRAPETEGAIRKNLDALPSLAQQSGMTMTEYMAEIVRRGWQAFYAIDGKPKGGGFDWLTGQ